MRIGAGRPAQRAKAEHFTRLDVRHWQRQGVLRPGASGAWVWRNSETGERTASIGYRVEAEAVWINYSIDDKPSSQRVSIDRTACTYGGKRSWFVCPIRGERVAVLYLRAGRFACRHCQRLAYASQSDDFINRTWRRQRQIEAKLGDQLQRPKGMHRATHESLLSIIWDCESQREEALACYLEVLTRRHPLLFQGLKY